MESLVSDASGNQTGLSAAGLQSGRELVVADSSSNSVGHQGMRCPDDIPDLKEEAVSV